jgi:peptidyl-prolyl cis-trans isomerase D
MISWIQRTFQHHFRTVFAVLLAVTIISFIATIGATPGVGRAERRDVKRDFFGYNLASQEDMGRVISDASMSIELQMGSGGVDPEQVKQYALERVAALHLADEWHIPAATPAEVTDYIKTLGMFKGQDGQFDANRYNSFRDSLKLGSQASEGDIARVIGDQVRVQKVEQLLDGPGYVLPADVKTQLVLSDTTWTIATATVDYASFAPDIKASDAELEKYYKDNAAKYQIPQRIVAGYIDYPASNYLNDVKLSELDIRAYYDANPARFPAPKPKVDDKAAAKPDAAKPADAAASTPPNKPDSSADYALVKPQVETALRLERARQLAAKAASDLAFALYEAKVTAGPAFDSFLSARKLKIAALAPFSQEAGPAELGNSPDISEALPKLDAQHFYSESVTTPVGAAILIWKGTLPPKQPALADVREKVKSDYLDNEKRKLFVDLGRTLKGLMETRLKAGDTFEKAVAFAASDKKVKIEEKALPAFDLKDRPKDVDQSLTASLEHLDKGQISDMAVEADKGTFVFALDKKAPDLKETSPRFAEMRGMLAGYMARQSASTYLNDLVSQELKRTEIAVK